jgi:molecular chaperone HscC
VQAALKSGDAAVEDMVVTDVAPFTMGIASATRMGSQQVSGLFSPILERGTVIPASRVERYQTMGDMQREILIEVYQGEHSLCRDNTKLGSYRVSGLPRGPAGSQRIEVRFSYDLNGILEVDTTVLGTDKTASLVIQQRPGTLSPSQIEEARENLARLKFHPREALPNRTALARADALFVELQGDRRQLLAYAMTKLRGALETQHSATIAEAREELLSLLEALK